MHGEDADRSRLGAHRSCLGSQALNDKGEKNLSCEAVMIMGTKATGTKGTYGQGTKDSTEMKFKRWPEMHYGESWNSDSQVSSLVSVLGSPWLPLRFLGGKTWLSCICKGHVGCSRRQAGDQQDRSE